MKTTVRFVGDYLRSIPISIGFAVVLVVTAIITGNIADFTYGDVTEQTWGIGVSTLAAGQWWTLLSGFVIPGDPAQLVAGVLLSLTVLGVSERILGPRRLIVAFLVTGLLGFGIGSVLQWIGSELGEWWALATSTDLTMDPITPIIGTLLVASARMNALWRRRTRVVAISVVLMFVLYDGDSSNTYRLIAALVGLVLGWLLARREQPSPWHRSSHRETRILLATVVAVTGVGPVISLINPDGYGAMAAVGALFRTFPDRAETMATCKDQVSAFCEQQFVLVSLSGVGPILLTLVPLVLLLVAAWGLRKGRRMALWLAIAVNLALAALAYVLLDVLQTLQDVGSIGQGFDFVDFAVWIGSAVLIPIALAIVLFRSRRHFQIRAPREAAIRLGMVSALALVILSALYAIVGSFNLGSYVPEATVFQVLLDTPRRFLPVNFLGTTGTIIVPSGGPALLAFQWVGPLFWAIVIWEILRAFRATDATVQVGEHLTLNKLLRRGGGGTLSWMATWPGNTYWFSADGQSAVAYRVINDVAITMSDPICPPGTGGAVIREFADFCDSRSWTPVFYSVHGEHLPTFQELGWQYMSVGEETLIHPLEFDMVGKSWQSVRSALNRGVKEGMTIEWTSYDELSLSHSNQINAISEAWVQDKELPEMGFTLGGIDEIKDRDVKLMLAIGPAGEIHAVTSWMPTFRDGEVIGYTIDFMRRADGSMSGTMEYLIASTALHLKELGIEVLSLSGAPLAHAPLAAGQEPAPATIMTGVLEFLAKALEPAYGFTSLFRFKAKFNPEYSTIYMAYPDPLALPAIGTAIGKAYLPTVSTAEALALIRTLSGQSADKATAKQPKQPKQPQQPATPTAPDVKADAGS